MAFLVSIDYDRDGLVVCFDRFTDASSERHKRTSRENIELVVRWSGAALVVLHLRVRAFLISCENFSLTLGRIKTAKCVPVAVDTDGELFLIGADSVGGIVDDFDLVTLLDALVCCLSSTDDDFADYIVVLAPRPSLNLLLSRGRSGRMAVPYCVLIEV